MLALARHRAVQARRGGTLGPVRLLSRSLGMGGTASPLGWNMSYDPIVWVLRTTISICCPTYVDDLAALTTGPSQTFRAQFLLLVAGHAAGLRVLTHRCQWLLIHDPHLPCWTG